MTTQIKRKAVPNSSRRDIDSRKTPTPESTLPSNDSIVLNDRPKDNEKAEAPLVEGESRPDFDQQLQDLDL